MSSLRSAKTSWKNRLLKKMKVGAIPRHEISAIRKRGSVLHRLCLVLHRNYPLHHLPLPVHRALGSVRGETRRPMVPGLALRCMEIISSVRTLRAAVFGTRTAVRSYLSPILKNAVVGVTRRKARSRTNIGTTALLCYLRVQTDTHDDITVKSRRSRNADTTVIVILPRNQIVLPALAPANDGEKASL